MRNLGKVWHEVKMKGSKTTKIQISQGAGWNGCLVFLIAFLPFTAVNGLAFTSTLRCERRRVVNSRNSAVGWCRKLERSFCRDSGSSFLRSESTANTESNREESTTKSTNAESSLSISGPNYDSISTTTASGETILPIHPKYSVRGPVGLGNFTISRYGGPTEDELTNENLIKIVRLECNDLEVNTLVWKCLGYRFDEDKEEWTNTECFPNWKAKHPTPPDLIGMKRIYSRDVDEVSLRSNQDLVRSIPQGQKQWLKPTLKPLGFSGYKFDGLTPNKTRRAQCTNWLIYYREELMGYTIEELKERRNKRQEAQAAEDERKRKEAEEKGEEFDDFKTPVREVV